MSTEAMPKITDDCAEYIDKFLTFNIIVPETVFMKPKTCAYVRAVF